MCRTDILKKKAKSIRIREVRRVKDIFYYFWNILNSTLTEILKLYAHMGKKSCQSVTKHYCYVVTFISMQLLSLIFFSNFSLDSVTGFYA